MLSSTPFRTVLVVALTIALVGGAIAFGGAAALDQIQDADQRDAESDADVQQSTSLRVVHASPDAPAVDVLVDNETVLSDAAFGDVSDYLPLEAGTYNVTIAAADDSDTVLFDDEVTFEPRTVTTVAASGEISEDANTSFQPIAFEDDAFTPADNESALSVAHLAPDAPAVDVTADDGSVVLAENVSFRNTSDYVTVPAGDYTAEIRAASAENNGSVVTTVDLSLEGGTAYSAFAVGYLNPEEAPADTPFEVVLAEDATLTVELPSDEAMDDDDADDEEDGADDDEANDEEAAAGNQTDTGNETDVGNQTDAGDGADAGNETDAGDETDTGDGTDGNSDGDSGGEGEPGNGSDGDDDEGDAGAGNGDASDDDGDAEDGDDSSQGDDGTDDSSPQGGPETIAECRTIEDPGTYEVTQDIGSTNVQSIDLGNGIVRPTCLAIQSSDVVLDGGGSVVSGSGDDQSVGVHVYDPAGSTVQNVTVSDLQIEDWSNGVQVGVDAWAVTPAGSTTASIENVQSNDNDHHGFFIVGSGIELSSVVANDNGASGIGVFYSSGVQVTGAATTGNADHGVGLLAEVFDSAVTDVTTTDNGGAEIYVGEPSSGNAFTDLTYGADDDAVEGFDGSENTIDDPPEETGETDDESDSETPDENGGEAGESPGGNESVDDDAGEPADDDGNDSETEADDEPESDDGTETDAGNETDAGDEPDVGDETDAGDGADTGNETDAGDGTDEGDETDAGNETDVGDEPDAGGDTDTGNETDAEDGTDEGDETDAGNETDAGDEPDAGGDTDGGNETAGNVSS